MKFEMITIGGATEDITFYTQEGVLINNKKDLLKQKLLAFEYGAKIKIDKAYYNFGGGAANTAVCFSKLGFKVACLVAVGDDDRGERVIKNLKTQGVDISLVQKVKFVQTGFSFILIGPNNEHILFSNRAANDELGVGRKEKEYLDNTKWLYLTSLSGKWKPLLNEIFKINVNIAWNPGHRQIISGLTTIGKYFKLVKALIVNKDEATELVCSDKKFRNKSISFFDKMKNLLAGLYGWGPKIVLITDGKKGADAYDGNKFYHHDAVKEKRRVDTTGVGDTFGSSFIAGLELYNGNILRAMHLGAKNTASDISQPGAQAGLLSKKDIQYI